MSEISEEATNLIDNFEYAVEDAVSDYTMACGASQKHQARRNLEDYIAELEAARRWIPVSERLPEANKCVLIYDAGGNMTVDILVKSGGVETYFWLPKYRILFWMPLPESPKEREE